MEWNFVTEQVLLEELLELEVTDAVLAELVALVLAEAELVEEALVVDEAALVVVDSVVDAAVVEVFESFVFDVSVVVDAVSVVLDFAAVLVVLASVVVEAVESSVVALFFSSCLVSGMIHSCINHTASALWHPREVKHGEMSSKRKALAWSRRHFEIESLFPQDVRITMSSKSLFTHWISIAETAVIVARSNEERMMGNGNKI